MMRHDIDVGPLRYVLGTVFGLSALAFLFGSGLGVLRYLMGFGQNEGRRRPGETLGFILCVVPLAMVFVGIRLAEIFG